MIEFALTLLAAFQSHFLRPGRITPRKSASRLGLIRRIRDGRLNEVALPSAAATDASRAVFSIQWAAASPRGQPGFSHSCLTRKCLICRKLQFKSHSAKTSRRFLQTALSKAAGLLSVRGISVELLPVESWRLSFLILFEQRLHGRNPDRLDLSRRNHTDGPAAGSFWKG